MIEPCEEVKRVEQRYEKALDDMEKHYKDVFDKIRAEIEDYVCNHETNTDKAQGMLNALQILDKYR